MDVDSGERAARDLAMRQPGRTILLGTVMLFVGCWFWYWMVGNPLNDLALIRRAEVAPGFIVYAWEEADSGDEGGARFLHGATYTYRLPDGRQFTQKTKSEPGELNPDLGDVEAEPYPIEVEYLPDDPAVSRIKGSGSDSISDWLWRKAGLGAFLLIICIAPGIGMMRLGLCGLRKCSPQVR